MHASAWGRRTGAASLPGHEKNNWWRSLSESYTPTDRRRTRRPRKISVYGSGCVAEDGEEGAGTCDSFGSETNGLARRTDLRCASPA
jgi:hypothetical protein